MLAIGHTVPDGASVDLGSQQRFFAAGDAAPFAREAQQGIPHFPIGTVRFSGPITHTVTFDHDGTVAITIETSKNILARVSRACLKVP
jgi:hypothetical protein